MNNPQIIKRLELHYVLADDTEPHALDAFVRNKCEQAFLQIALEVAQSLKENVSISVSPHSEGGLRDFYTFILSPKGGALAAWIAILIPIVMQLTSKEDAILTDLSKTKTTLEIEKLNLEIAQLRKQTSSQNIIETIQNNPKIQRQKSNFYKHTIGCRKIKAVELSEIDVSTNNIIPKSTVFIARPDFDKFVQDEIPVAPETIENVVIEIIAPVLIKSKLSWKGIFKQNGNSTLIDFKVVDVDFLDRVQSKEMHFRHGTHIECTLETFRKVDDDGKIVVTRHHVTEVTKTYDGAGTDIVFPRKKTHATQKNNERQMLLGFNEGEQHQ